VSDQFRTETMLVTPDMARVWLQKNKLNRTVNKKRVTLYAEEMKHGRWFLHHQGIAFYEDGTFADGQHRLLAIIESGCSVPMTVTRGLSTESGLMIDAHQQRKVHQAIKICGMADWIGKDHVAVIRLIDAINHGGTSRKISNVDVINIGEMYRQTVQFAASCLPTKKRYLTSAPSQAAIGIASKYEDHGRLAEFSRVFTTGIPDSSEDVSALRAREWLIENGGMHAGGAGQMEVIKRMQRAIKAFCEREKLSKLYQPASFIYMPVPDFHGESQ
jgi:hypothetical protein